MSVQLYERDYKYFLRNSTQSSTMMNFDHEKCCENDKEKNKNEMMRMKGKDEKLSQDRNDKTALSERTLTN
jgi:hypothetical protein